jgi:hypothetical protein
MAMMTLNGVFAYDFTALNNAVLKHHFHRLHSQHLRARLISRSSRKSFNACVMATTANFLSGVVNPTHGIPRRTYRNFCNATRFKHPRG